MMKKNKFGITEMDNETLLELMEDCLLSLIDLPIEEVKKRNGFNLASQKDGYIYNLELKCVKVE